MLAFDGNTATRKGIEMISASLYLRISNFIFIVVGQESSAVHGSLN